VAAKGLAPMSWRDGRQRLLCPDRLGVAARVPLEHGRFFEMELGGLEPPTSWVRSRRSPN
jgi:hypothetical protein